MTEAATLWLFEWAREAKLEDQRKVAEALCDAFQARRTFTKEEMQTFVKETLVQ